MLTLVASTMPIFPTFLVYDLFLWHKCKYRLRIAFLAPNPQRITRDLRVQWQTYALSLRIRDSASS